MKLILPVFIGVMIGLGLHAQHSNKEYEQAMAMRSANQGVMIERIFQQDELYFLNTCSRNPKCSIQLDDDDRKRIVELTYILDQPIPWVD